MIRAFLALPVGDDMGRALQSLQAGLRIGRPVPPENFHLTLGFLGDRPRPVLEDLHLALEELRAPAFDISITGVDMFTRSQSGSLHAVIARCPALSHLRRKIATAIREAGIDLARGKFVPHVTLARFGAIGEDERQHLRDGIARRVGFVAGPFPVPAFGLYRSTLRSSEAPIYEELATYPLTG